jgi:hypothetical protein
MELRMNTNLLLAFGCIKQAVSYIKQAEAELYLDDLVTETDEAEKAIRTAIEKVEIAYAGVIDDVDSENSGLNVKQKQPRIRMVNAMIGVVE